MTVQRQSKRFEVEIPVIITSVLDTIEAAIVDLTEYGAQIIGCAFTPGTRIQIDYMTQTLFAQCRWTEIDRFGVKFLFPLVDGPLVERLAVARASQLPYERTTGTHMAFAPLHGSAAGSANRLFAHTGHGDFGKRG